MSDTPDNTDETKNAEQNAETPAEGEEQKPADEAEVKPDDTENGGDEGDEEKPDEGDDDSKLDLDGAKKALSKVRQSEAKMRVRLRDIEAKLADAKTPEQVEELLSEVRKDTASELHLERAENAALQAGLPAEWADRLKGSTKEELVEDAKALAKLTGKKLKGDPEVSGGLEPGDKPEAFGVEQALEAARKAKSRRR